MNNGRNFFTKIKTSPKALVGLVVAVIFIGGFLYFLFGYLRIWTEILGENSPKNPLGSQAVDTTILEGGYANNFKQIIASYIEQSSGTQDSQLTSETNKAQAALLALKVPALYKGKHLQAVLILAQIEELTKSGSSGKIPPKLEELKALANF